MTYVAEDADIFSLGILLFTLFFGQPPFYDNDPAVSPLLATLTINPDLFFKTHDVTRHMNVSQGFKDLLVKMLAIEPSQRLRIAEIVA